jgi:hypothetical protein
MGRTVVTEPSLLSLDRCEYFSALQLQSFEVFCNAGNDNNEAAIISSQNHGILPLLFGKQYTHEIVISRLVRSPQCPGDFQGAIREYHTTWIPALFIPKRCLKLNSGSSAGLFMNLMY